MAGLSLLAKEFMNKVSVHLGYRVVDYPDWIMLRSSSIGRNGLLELIYRYLVSQKSGRIRASSDIHTFMEFLLSERRISYSQSCQDIFVQYCTQAKRDGRYLEAGAADGYTHSNTLSLEQHFGWSGVLIEPDPAMYGECVLSRGQSNTVVNGALDPTGQGVGTGTLIRARQLSSLESINAEDMHADARKASRLRASVRLYALKTFLRGDSVLDYLSLDLEGAEAGVVTSVEWSNVVRPQVITVETNARRLDQQIIRSTLVDAGYRQFAEDTPWFTGNDMWFTAMA